MGPVSVYRLDSVGAGPAHVFRAGVRDAGPPGAAWLGWLPLTPVDWAGPDIAEAGDGWLTAPPGRSDFRPVVPGDVVTVDDAAGELLARRACGLGTFTDRPADVPAAGSFWALSAAASVGDDLVDRLARACAARRECVESSKAVSGRGPEAVQGSLFGAAGESDVAARRVRAERGLWEHHRRLHLLLEAVVQIGVFDPETARR